MNNVHRDYVQLSKYHLEANRPPLWLITENEVYSMKKGNPMKLYQFQIDNVDNYGHYLATNSQGDWVMEVKGSGVIVAIPKKSVQEVLPFTVGVKFGEGGKVYHYLAEAGKIDLGFYIVSSALDHMDRSYVVVQVVELDTKSASATKEFTPLAKLNTL